jgi:hypothetical protein
VDGDYDIGFQSDDGSTLSIENTGSSFQIPLLESATGASAVTVTVAPIVAVNIGSVGSPAGDASGPPIPTDPFLEGGSGNALLGQPGALVNDAGTSALFAVASVADTLNVPFDPALNPLDTDIKAATESAPGAGDGLDALPEMTIEMWCKPTTTPGAVLCPLSNMWFNGSTATARNGWLFYQTPTNEWEFRVGDDLQYLSVGFDSSPLTPGTPAITPGQWNHVVGVVRVDKSDPAVPLYELDLYVDGELANSIILVATPIANRLASVRFGATTQPAGGTGQNFLGCVDEVAL